MMLFPLFFMSVVTFAQEEKSAFERSLERDTSVLSEELTVAINGKRYQKIEFNGGRYYVVLYPEKKTADVYCAPPAGADHETIVEEPTDPVRRPAAFVRAFHDACAKMKGSNQRTDLHLTPEMGLKAVKK